MTDLSSFHARIEDIYTWFRKECSLLRTGRATTVVLDAINVESYGSFSPISHVANISMEDARTIRIAPWDKSQVKAIQGAIEKADIGLSVSADDAGLRVIFPELTSERRAQIIKILKGRLEDARISVRKEREEMISSWKAAEKNGEMSEDEHARAKEELQKAVDVANRTLEDIADKKEAEIVG